jgi:integrase
MYVHYNKPTKWFYARWREKQPDGTEKHPSVPLMRRSDKYHSKADVRKSPEYKAVLAQHGETDFDAKHAKLLLAVAEARGKHKPDAQDAAIVQRVVSDDIAENTLLTTFVETVYFPWADANLRPKTVHEYRSMWSRYAIASMASELRVQDFETHHGSEILASIAAKFDVSKTTLQHVKFLLSGIFVLAKNKGLYRGINPVQDVMLPKVRGARETHEYTLDEILAMLRLPFDAMTKAAIGFASFAGLRESEIAGLHWSDYDGTDIHVCRSIDRVTGEPNPPKTPKSAAPVPVIPNLKVLLDELKVKCPLLPDGNPMPDAPMFPGIRQKYADLDKLALRVIRPAIESARLNWYGWHGFRRGIASNLFEVGCDDLTVQRILRHSKVQVTREHYIKVRDVKVDAAMARLDAAIVTANGNHAVQGDQNLNSAQHPRNKVEADS